MVRIRDTSNYFELVELRINRVRINRARPVSSNMVSSLENEHRCVKHYWGDCE